MKIAGDRVKAARKAKGVSREQLAVAIGVSYATIGNVECDVVDVAAGTAYLISIELDVPLESLFLRESPLVSPIREER